MTNPFNKPPEQDPLATYDKRPSVSFDQAKPEAHRLNAWAQLEVQGYAEAIPSRDQAGNPETYEDTGKPKMKLVLAVIDRGVESNLWAKIPSGLYAALKAAQAKLVEDTGDKDRKIRPGDLLAVRYIGDDKSRPAKMGNHPKMFQAVVKPGTMPQVNTSDNPFETAAQQPAAAAAPVAQPAAPAPTQPPQTAPSDPWAAQPAAAAPQAAQQPAAAPSDPFAAQPTGVTPPAPQAAPAPAEDDPFAGGGDAPPY